MKKSLFALALSGSLLLLGGCSSIQVSQDYDASANFNNIHSYEWLPADKQTKPTAADFKQNNPLIAKRVETAIANELALKGQSIVEGGKKSKADAYITYHISAIEKINASPVSTSIGFGTGFGGRGGFTSLGFQTGSTIQQYQEGQLVVDILSLSGQLLWRGSSTTPLEEHATPEETTKLINEVIKKLMAQYPPQGKK